MRLTLAEIKSFQKRQGLKVDGKIGRQTFNRVLKMEAELKNKPQTQCTVWGALLALGAVTVAWGVGLLDWLK